MHGLLELIRPSTFWAILSIPFTWRRLRKIGARVLQALENGRSLEFLLNRVTYELLSKFEVPPKWQKALQQLPQTVFSQFSFQSLLARYLPGLGPRLCKHILEAAAIACYQQSSEWPVVQTLVCDDAAQFKLLTEDLSLCWVHEARHYKKLSPLVAYHRRLKRAVPVGFLGLLP